MSELQTKLQFKPFQLVVDSEFWFKLHDLKLNDLKLNDNSLPVRGFYSYMNRIETATVFNLDCTAFNDDKVLLTKSIFLNGNIIIKNTFDSFKSSLNQELLDAYGKKLWDHICSKTYENFSYLCEFLLVCYADLKKYRYYYWCAFPAVVYPQNVYHISKPTSLSDVYTESQIVEIFSAVQSYINKSIYYFIMSVENSLVHIYELKDFNEAIENSSIKSVYFCFLDPSSSNKYPGWPLRNYLAFIFYHWSHIFQDIHILCLRQILEKGVYSIGSSLLLHLSLNDVNSKNLPSVVGWERNEKGKLSPKVADLSSVMNPYKLAESAVELNLKLMKWRMAPSLNLKLIENTHFLLLGIGTLGCNVARCLLGWGAKKITLLDNGKVSYSNPVRQSLYTFSHCHNGGRLKSEAAAESLSNIFPGVQINTFNISIPIPDHPVSDSLFQEVQRDVALLDNLIQSHDVIFILLDSREVRWLPTLLGAFHEKLVINAALGFDTYLIMRHGIRNITKEVSDDSFVTVNNLSCYFCNDVTAPGNSSKDRAMDQQCTIVRPGLAYIAAAIAVELCISVIQHPLSKMVPAKLHQDGDVFEFGSTPHSIRGFLSSFQQSVLICHAFDRCIGCSRIVLSAYQNDGFKFLIKVFNNAKYLEEITGLKSLQIESENAEIWAYSDSEDVYLEIKE